jgi:hypothetical protein
MSDRTDYQVEHLPLDSEQCPDAPVGNAAVGNLVQASLTAAGLPSGEACHTVG